MAPDDPADHDSRRTRPLRAIAAPPMRGTRAALLDQLRSLRDRDGAAVADVEAAMSGARGVDVDRWSDDDLRDLIATVLERIAPAPAI